ncbi:MAG: N-acetylmuramoyl-L-alanine amidase, partial [Limisphaerales bacterium]
DYRFRNTQAVSDPATWTGNLPSSKSYKVYAWWSQGSNRSTTAPYIVNHSGGSTTVQRNQQTNGGSWQLLGTWNMNAGSNQVRLSCWTTTGFVVIADAVRWE